MGIVGDSIKTVQRHYKSGNFNWPMIIYIGLAHVAAIVGIFRIPECHRYTLLFALFLWPLSGLGIIFLYNPIYYDVKRFI